MELAERLWDAAIAVDPEAKRTGNRRYGSPSALSDLWTAAGFANVETSPPGYYYGVSFFRGLVGRIQSDAQGPPKLYISNLSEKRRQLLKEQLHTDILGSRPMDRLHFVQRLGQCAE
jgi:hypothetical protein